MTLATCLMAVALVGGSFALSSAWYPPFGAYPLTDLLEIVVRKREILAIDAFGGSSVQARLGVGEYVEWSGSRGRVGLAITNRRILGITPDAANWQEFEFGVFETAPRKILLGDRIAIVVTNLRVFALGGYEGRLFAREIGPQEDVIDAAAGENVGVVVTSRRSLGVSGFASGFAEISMPVKEPVEAVRTHSDFVTVATPRRLLIFRAPGATWEDRPLSLR